MKKQKEEELGKKGSQVKSEETPCPEHKECENTDKKSCRKEESCQKGEDKECKKLEEKITALENEKKSVEEKLAKEKDDYVRLMAEFETFRRRTAEEKLALVSSAASETIKGLLPVLDDCERAMEILNTSSDEAAKEGTGLIGMQKHLTKACFLKKSLRGSGSLAKTPDLSSVFFPCSIAMMITLVHNHRIGCYFHGLCQTAGILFHR